LYARATALPDRRKRLRSAEAASGKAAKLRPDYADANCVKGVSLMFSNRAGSGIADCERALAIDRNLASAHWAFGLAKYLTGSNEEAEAHAVEALRISPRDTFAGNWSVVVGLAKLGSGRDEEAVVWLSRSIVAPFFPRRGSGASSRLEEAREAANLGLELNPSLVVVAQIWRERSRPPVSR
jgi:tetratricopeptide (TPR) repeat protein